MDGASELEMSLCQVNRFQFSAPASSCNKKIRMRMCGYQCGPYFRLRILDIHIMYVCAYLFIPVQERAHSVVARLWLNTNLALPVSDRFTISHLV